MRNEFDYAHERPSRLSRAVVLLSTLGVALIAAWVFTPILLANYTSYTATVPAGAKPSDTVRAPATASSAIVVPSAVAAPAAPPAAASSGVLTTTALAATSDDAAPAAPVNASTRSLIPWPGDSPPTAPPAASAAPADTGSVRTAAVDATADPVDPANTVPLPRRRPTRAIAAYLAIPLPRPRPEIVSENTPPSRPNTFDLQVERMR